MRVVVRLFASYREAAGVGHIELELPDGATARDAIRAVLAEHPLVAEGRQVVVARNEEYVDVGATLSDGDDLALIPPVSGGTDGPASPARADPGAGALGREATPQEEVEDADRASASAESEDRMPRVRISSAPLSVDDAIEAVRRDGYGAVVVFLGTVRDASRGKRVTKLGYEAYGRMAERTMREIADRLEREHAPSRLVLHHRVGDLAIGEIAVIVAAAAPHRDAAFTAARSAIDELKSVVPIWKKEYSDDGAVWVEEHA